jgi:hypothetical protein
MSESKHVTHFQQGHQRRSENIVAWSPAALVGRSGGLNRGALIVTTERVVFCRKAWFGGEFVASVDLPSITSVERTASMGTHRVAVKSSSTALECVLNWASKEQARSLLEALDARREASPAASL